ncbi:MAG: hypothetical protein HW380_2394 [Magnetococcales bacterium]|nr:hypothetical protein [Magnetococcales bacterium]
MNTAFAFDTHSSVKQLVSTGFTEEQAETQVRLLSEVLEAQLSTKADVARVDTHVLELKRDMKEMEMRLKHDLTLRLGGMMAASIAVVAALVKLL